MIKTKIICDACEKEIVIKEYYEDNEQYISLEANLNSDEVETYFAEFCLDCFKKHLLKYMVLGDYMNLHLVRTKRLEKEE